jgi:hypothetical protein
MTASSMLASLLFIVGPCAAVALVCKHELARCMSWGTDREAIILRTLIASLDQRPDLDDADRADLLAARVALDAWQSGARLTILAVDHASFIYTAYAMLDRVWQRIFRETLPAGRFAMPTSVHRRFRR